MFILHHIVAHLVAVLWIIPGKTLTFPTVVLVWVFLAISLVAKHSYLPCSSNLRLLICNAPLGIKVKRSPVVIETFDPCFLQPTLAFGLECFTLQKSLAVSPNVTLNVFGTTSTLDEIPEKYTQT